MGIYATQCPTCKEMHQWFSGNIDQRCTNCRSGPPPLKRYNGEQLPTRDPAERFLTTKEMEQKAHAEKMAKMEAPERMSFGQWARNIRTIKLIERCVKAETGRDTLAMNFQLMEHDRDTWKIQAQTLRGAGLVQTKEVERLKNEIKVVEDERDAARARSEGWYTQMRELEARTDQVDRLQQMLDVQEIKMRKMDELESDLRQSQRLLGAYIKVAGRRYKRIAELEDTLRNVRLAAGLTPAAPGPIIRSDDKPEPRS